MDLSKESIVEIERLAVAASGAEAHAMQIETGRVRIWNKLTGAISYVPIPELPIDASVISLDDMERVAADTKPGSAIWVSADRATLFVDSSRIGKAVLSLRLNPVLSVLQSLKRLKPKDLHTKLRVDLFDTRITPADFAEVMGVLKFEVNETSEAAIRKGDESIGKSVRSKVTAESEIPDAVVFSFRVYLDLADLDTRASVSCAVVTEPAEGTISVIPYPGEVEKAVLEAVGKVASDLRVRVPDIPVICGSCK